MNKIDAEIIARIKKILKIYLSIILAGLLYALFVKIAGFGIPCIFHLITGKYCPGCGITRMCLALLKFDFLGAAKSNLFVLCLLPFGLIILIYKTLAYIKKGETSNTLFETVFYIIAFVFAIIFTIMRNMDAYSFLCP